MTKLTRRTFMATATVTAAASAAPDAAAFSGALGELRVAQLREPLGLEDANPTFSWQINSSRRGAKQSAYRIVVARTAAAAQAGRGEIWDSGRVTSERSSGVRYEGPPLQSRQRYHWAVEVWDERGRRIGRRVSWWEMGLLSPSDWRAAWLAVEGELERDDREAGLPYFTAESPPAGQTRKFRLDFTNEHATECLLTIVAEGKLVALTMDGAAIDIPEHSQHAFGQQPALRTRLNLAPGPHALCAEIEAKSGLLARPTTGVAAQLRLTDANGAVARVTSPWRTAIDPQGDWCNRATDVSGWPLAEAAAALTTPWPPTPARMMRRAFRTQARISSARLYVAALGAYEARLNGRLVSDDKLAGESTDFSKRVLYRVHDVTRLLDRGDNVLGLVVGDGWFASYQAPVNRYPFGEGPRRVIAQLEITYADGAVEYVVTDESWRAAVSPVVASEIYDGETYDARLEQPGWDRAGFDDSAWSTVWHAPAPSAELVALTSPPIRVTQTLRPLSVTRMGPSLHVVDFGQNFAGWARLRLRASAGERIVMRFAELLDANERVDQSNLRAARASDIYITGDERDQVFEPRFTYHGFRYVEVEGLPSLAPAQIEAVVAHSALTETGDFACGSPLINQVWRNAFWSQRSNFVSVPTDCPQRDERLGWTGDANAFWDAASYNMDTYAFTRRFMNDVRDAQKANGAFPIWAPMDPRTARSPLTAQPTPGWADGGVTLPWVAARQTGDMTIVEENWSAMRRFVDGVLDANGDYVWRNNRGLDLGDWLSVDATSPLDATTPKDLLATALLIQCFDRMADMAAWTGREEEQRLYRTHAERGRGAFAGFISADGVAGNGSHTSYALTLALRLAPESLRPLVAQNFVASIRARGTSLTCGFVGTPVALDAVAETGDVALAYDLLLRDRYPSWGYMVARGATTMWERWNSDVGDVAMNSYNHYAFGAVAGFMYRRVAGITSDGPGFANLNMAPLVDARVRRARATYQSVKGPISAEWRIERDALTYDVDLPANVSARVRLPGDEPSAIREVSSGRHSFRMTRTN